MAREDFRSNSLYSRVWGWVDDQIDRLQSQGLTNRQIEDHVWGQYNHWIGQTSEAEGEDYAAVLAIEIAHPREVQIAREDEGEAVALEAIVATALERVPV